MRITCWGARGSIPVSGKDFNVYGGDTPCIEIRTGNDEIIIIDCGTGARRLGKSLAEERRRRLNILFTHAHWDHLMGFPFFMPLYIGGTDIAFYGCPFAQKSIRTILATTMEPPYFPVRMEEAASSLTFNDSCIQEFVVDTVTVKPVLLSHPNQGLGYKFVENGKSFVYLTDNELGYRHPGGLGFDEYRDFSRGADLLIHDAEYTEEEYRRKRTWGHSMYKEALRLAMEAGVKKLGLFHHNQDRTDEHLDRIVAECREAVAAAGSGLECFAVAQDMTIDV